jgi:DNA-directed RNA polymerase specialized sigma24 family protein
MSSSTLPLFPTDEGWPYPDGELGAGAAVDDGEPDLDDLDLRVDPHAYATLTARERSALFAHFGIGGGARLSMKELARMLGCSHAEARSLLGTAIDKVRRHLTATA